MRLRNRRMGARRVKAKLCKFRNRMIVECFTYDQTTKGVSVPRWTALRPCHEVRKSGLFGQGSGLRGRGAHVSQVPLEHPAQDRQQQGACFGEYADLAIGHENTRSS